jgi:pimeloyl-ACP methyl ester carboxylesterase
MATFVLVHGAFAGGWVWRKPAKLLQAAGHTVLRPTLTGLGERVHLATPDVGLYTHIEDVVNVFHYEEVQDAILVGHSYGGMVVTGVAERIPELISQLVYLDADVPQDGQSESDLYPEAAAYLGDLVRQYGDGWLLPNPRPDLPLCTAHPLKTCLEPVHLHNPLARDLPRSFIWCSKDKDPADAMMNRVAEFAAQVRVDPKWRYYELPTGHDAWLTMPEATAEVLLQIAAEDTRVRLPA